MSMKPLVITKPMAIRILLAAGFTPVIFQGELRFSGRIRRDPSRGN